MDWLVTKSFKHDKKSDTFVEDLDSSIIGLSELTGGGDYVVSGKIDKESIQKAIEDEYYQYIFKVFNSNDDLVAEGLCDGISAAPLLSINREFCQFDIEYIQFIEDRQVIDVLLIEDELDMSMEEA